MTKLFLSSIFFLFSSYALACRPAPLISCERLDLTKSEGDVSRLLKGVRDYQALLDLYLIKPSMVTSCFNNHFAVHYGQVFSEALSTNQGRTCGEQWSQVQGVIQQFISDDTIEFRAVKSIKAKRQLKEKAQVIKQLLSI